jgi:hypothetical protein
MATGTYEETIDDEVIGGLQRAEQLPPNIMLLKMENETIMSAAAMRPRNPMAIVKQLKELIDAYPAAAEEAIYSKPVGKVSRVECGKCKVKYEEAKVTNDTHCPACGSRERLSVRQVQKYAEGLSIRAAESIRSVFGYTRLATTCEILDNGDARLSGTLVDYAAGNMTSDERIVSRSYKSREGAMVQTPIDRFTGVVVKAEKAKLRRDVILESTPAIIKALFRDECEKKMKELVSLEQVEQVIFPALAEHGLTQKHVEEIIGRPASLGWKVEDKLQLRKILNALNTGETSATELIDDLAGKNGMAASQPKVKPSKLNEAPKSTEAIDPPHTDGAIQADPSKPTAEELRDEDREAKRGKKQSSFAEGGQ